MANSRKNNCNVGSLGIGSIGTMEMRAGCYLSKELRKALNLSVNHRVEFTVCSWEYFHLRSERLQRSSEK